MNNDRSLDRSGDTNEVTFIPLCIIKRERSCMSIQTMDAILSIGKAVWFEVFYCYTFLIVYLQKCIENLLRYQSTY